MPKTKKQTYSLYKKEEWRKNKMAKEILKATDLFKIKGSYIIGGTKIETGVN